MSEAHRAEFRSVSKTKEQSPHEAVFTNADGSQIDLKAGDRVRIFLHPSDLERELFPFRSDQGYEVTLMRFYFESGALKNINFIYKGSPSAAEVGRISKIEPIAEPVPEVVIESRSR